MLYTRYIEKTWFDANLVPNIYLVIEKGGIGGIICILFVINSHDIHYIEYIYTLFSEGTIIAFMSYLAVIQKIYT